jgi:hypothetical protein
VRHQVFKKLDRLLATDAQSYQRKPLTAVSFPQKDSSRDTFTMGRALRNRRSTPCAVGAGTGQ